METIYGNLQGLKSSHIKQLQRLSEQRPLINVCEDQVLQPDVQMVMDSVITHEPSCVLILKARNALSQKQLLIQV